MGTCLSQTNQSRDAVYDRELYNIRSKLNTVSRLHANEIAELKRAQHTTLPRSYDSDLKIPSQ